jgi:Carboxypeptidase regulatory-like domain
MTMPAAASRFKIFAVCLFSFALLTAPTSYAKNKDTTPGRLLTGKVLDKQDNPVIDAVVYVTDTRTRAVKTYIVGPDGTYRFPALATNVDYEIYAQSNGKTSDTKRMSQFDDRKVVDIILRIDLR